MATRTDEKANVQGKHGLAYKLDTQTLKYKPVPQKRKYGTSYKVDTQADFAEKALDNYLSYNEDKIMEALDGDEAVFDAKKHEAYNALYDYDTLDHDEGDLEAILNNIFEIGNSSGPLFDDEDDDEYEYEKMAKNYPLIFGDNNPTGIANPADYLRNNND